MSQESSGLFSAYRPLNDRLRSTLQNPESSEKICSPAFREDIFQTDMSATIQLLLALRSPVQIVLCSFFRFIYFANHSSLDIPFTPIKYMAAVHAITAKSVVGLRIFR